MKKLTSILIIVLIMFACVAESEARWYSPAMRRFISEDPIGFAGGDVNFYAYVDSVGKPFTPATNWYSYAGNNPVNNTDPLGLFVIGVGGGASGGIGGAVGGSVGGLIDFNGGLGLYGSISGSAGPGVAMGGGVDITISPDAENVCELGGSSTIDTFGLWYFDITRSSSEYGPTSYTLSIGWGKTVGYLRGGSLTGVLATSDSCICK